MEAVEGCLMESWPNDPEEGILASALRALLPAVSPEPYADGEYLVERGDTRMGIFKIEAGTVKVEHYEDLHADTDEDEVISHPAQP